MTSTVLPSEHFSYQNDHLLCEGVRFEDLAQQFGTPLYVYSRATMLDAFNVYQTILHDTPHLVCYALKANGNLALVQQLAQAGAGFDIVSEGELRRVIAAGGDTQKVIFSGVGKSESEIEFALTVGIRCFNVESIPELDRIQNVAARLNTIAPISIRVNPNVDAKTHPYISTGLKNNKFGVAYEDCLSLYQRAAQLSHLQIVGIDSHIGSQITEIDPYFDAADRVLDLVEQLREHAIALKHIDFGGGIGVRYQASDTTIDMAALIEGLKRKLHDRGLQDLEMIFEPGRSLVAACGTLLTRTQFVKTTPAKHFLITDASMTEMARPALYEAWMPILATTLRHDTEPCTVDVVGPVCESSDWLAKDRSLAVRAGDLLAITMAGAYGSSMASTYNARRRPAEVLVDGTTVHVIRERDTFEDLWAKEKLL